MLRCTTRRCRPASLELLKRRVAQLAHCEGTRGSSRVRNMQGFAHTLAPTVVTPCCGWELLAHAALLYRLKLAPCAPSHRLCRGSCLTQGPSEVWRLCLLGQPLSSTGARLGAPCLLLVFSGRLCSAGPQGRPAVLCTPRLVRAEPGGLPCSRSFCFGGWERHSGTCTTRGQTAVSNRMEHLPVSCTVLRLLRSCFHRRSDLLRAVSVRLGRLRATTGHLANGE